MLHHNARHGTRDRDFNRIIRVVAVHIAALAVSRVHARYTVGVEQGQIVAAHQLDFNRIAVFIKRCDAYNAVTVDICDVELNIADRVREFPLEITLVALIVVQRMQARRTVNCLAAGINAVHIKLFIILRACVSACVLDPRIGYVNGTGILRDRAIDLRIRKRFPIEALATNGTQATIIAIKRVIADPAVQRIVALLAKDQVVAGAAVDHIIAGHAAVQNFGQRHVVKQWAKRVVVRGGLAELNPVRSRSGHGEGVCLPFVARCDDADKVSAKVDLNLVVRSFDPLHCVEGEGILRSGLRCDVLEQPVCRALTVDFDKVAPILTELAVEAIAPNLGAIVGAPTGQACSVRLERVVGHARFQTAIDQQIRPKRCALAVAIDCVVATCAVDCVIAAVANDKIRIIGDNVAALVCWRVSVIIAKLHDLAKVFTVNCAVWAKVQRIDVVNGDVIDLPVKKAVIVAVIFFARAECENLVIIIAEVQGQASLRRGNCCLCARC